MSFADDVARSLKQLEALNQTIGGALPEAADAGAEVLRREAMLRAPVRTGKLKLTLVRKRGDQVYGVSSTSLVYSPQFWSKFVEYGVYGGQRKRPFMRPAADAKRREIAEAMRRVVVERAKRVTG